MFTCSGAAGPTGPVLPLPLMSPVLIFICSWTDSLLYFSADQSATVSAPAQTCLHRCCFFCLLIGHLNAGLNSVHAKENGFSRPCSIDPNIHILLVLSFPFFPLRSIDLQAANLLAFWFDGSPMSLAFSLDQRANRTTDRQEDRGGFRGPSS